MFTMTTRENNKYPIYEDRFGRKYLIDSVNGDVMEGFRVEDSVIISYNKSILTNTEDLVNQSVRTKLKKKNKSKKRNIFEEIN